MHRHRFLITLPVLAVLLMVVFPWGIDRGYARPLTGPGMQPDYYETPNWANSPPLRKFVDSLPGLCGTPNGTNKLGQCLPVAVPDQTTYPGSDYYEIELVEYHEQMHSDLPGPYNPATPGALGTRLRGYRQTNGGPNQPDLLKPHYLGPLIIAQKDRPVRIRFTNNLPAGSGGDLFLPVDTTVMGAGAYEINYDPVTMAPTPTMMGTFTQNRATIHLHGGRTPWISDGTTHQWITPAGETTAYPKGVSVQNVPDMPDPGTGSQTFYYTNQQSARLLFYHDHAWGITRLNVYAGEAAGYLIQDPVEQALVDSGKIPADQIPLIIQDKTFVDGDATRQTYVRNMDPTWNWGTGDIDPATGHRLPVTGDLWWPHVYMPAQNPFNPDMSGANMMGRWMYGPWFFPPTPVCGSSADAVPPLCISKGPVANEYYDPACDPEVAGFCQPPEVPGTPSPSWGAEAFLDTMMVNGTAYPSLAVQPQAYRFRILNASHDRFLNLQWYLADASVPPGCVTCAANTEVKMVPAVDYSPAYPSWPADGREGGVPDPTTRGPAWIQIGTEGGFLPAPVLLPNRPVSWNNDPTMFNMGNVNGGTLILGPAERADVIIDFATHAGKTLILYNDAPTAFPALDPHYNYYTGAPDRTSIGGAASTPIGFGPNIRTVMQVNVAGNGGPATPDYHNPQTLANLQQAFASTATSPGAFAQGQDPIIVGQKAYNSAYNKTFPATWPNWGVARISDTTISFQKLDGTMVKNFPMKPKAIHDEMGASFDDFGRMSAKLGLEVPFTNAAISNFILQNFVDPATEIIRPGQVQIWKITHNGVDTHPIHFHLMDVQLINRVGWDGFIRLPDANELGWKDTIRVSPLEDTIVALRPIMPKVPFALPNSIRPLNPAAPLGSMMGFSQIDTLTGGNLATPQTNQLTNFGHEYVWHCHILSHEENDMMRPLVLRKSALFDFDGDGNTDMAVWRPDTGMWSVVSSSTGISYDQQWGTRGDIPVPGDYDGDGNADLAVWRPSDGHWYVIRSSDGAVTTTQWGTGTTFSTPDIPVPGDYDGDGKTDLAVWRPSDGNWYVIRSSDGVVTTTQWGTGTIFSTPDIPVPGDYDGDGKTDIAVWRPSDGNWYVIRSSDGVVTTTQWGTGTTFTSADVPVPGDYDGDGKTDIAVWRPSDGNWYVIRSSDGVVTTTQWGTGMIFANPDVPVPGDYDGDGKTDIAVWRPSEGEWYIIPSFTETAVARQWGATTDIPIPR